jgi:hypothetical protein
MGWFPYIRRIDDLAPPFGVFVETRNYVEQAIYSILSNDFDVAALVAARIYPNLVPDESELVGATSIVKNGAFKDGGEWTWGSGWEWYIATESGKWDTDENFGELEQDIGIVSGHTYRTIFRLAFDGQNDAGIKVEVGGTQGSVYKRDDTYTEVLTAVDTGNLKFIGVSGTWNIGYGFVDNVYVYDLSASATLPAITYQEITAIRQYVFHGPIGMVRCRFQVNCWAPTYANADWLSMEVRQALDGYSGTVENQKVHFIELIDEGDMLENIAGLDVPKKYGKRLDFYVWVNELLD